MLVWRLNNCRPNDGREVGQPFAFQFRRQFLLGFRLRLTGDCAEESARSVLEGLHGAIRKRVAFRAPKFPADIARDILGIEFHSIENDPGCFHYIAAHAVARHPRNSVFSHRKPILSARAPPASESIPGSTRRWRVGDGCQPSRTFVMVRAQSTHCNLRPEDRKSTRLNSSHL